MAVDMTGIRIRKRKFRNQYHDMAKSKIHWQSIFSKCSKDGHNFLFHQIRVKGLPSTVSTAMATRTGDCKPLPSGV
jgi:hypothetical protein